MTIPAIVFMVLLMAVSGLTVDIQRYYGAHGQMQAYVDDVAIAAATELDQASDALTRSFRAAYGDANGGPLVAGPANSERFASDTTLTLQKVTFFSQIDADPGPTAATPTALEMSSKWAICKWDNGSWYKNTSGSWAADNTCKTDASVAATVRFVEVQAAPRTVNYVVLPIVNAFSSLSSRLAANNEVPTLNATFALRATAGFRRQICNSVPLMVCNPAEITQGTGAGFTASDWAGHQFAAKISGNSANWTPGEFGLTNNYPGTGANAMEEAMANVNSGSTCTGDNIQGRNGESTNKVQNGMNVRFDIYQQDEKNLNTSPNYLPAPNVLKGETDCNNLKQSNTTIPFPRDNCFMTTVPGGLAGTGCTDYPSGSGTHRYGDGKWDRADYWTTNHNGAPQPTGYIDAASSIGGWTRYQTYRYEIENPLMVNVGNENGAPTCSSGGTPDTNRDRDRRVLYVAVIDCIQNAGSLNSNANVPVKAYAKVFITEPVGNTDWGGKSRANLTWPNITTEDFMVEIFDVVKPNDSSGHLHVYPVLYR